MATGFPHGMLLSAAFDAPPGPPDLLQGRLLDHYLEVCEARGEEPDRPYSGNFLLRMGPGLHRAAADGTV